MGSRVPSQSASTTARIEFGSQGRSIDKVSVTIVKKNDIIIINVLYFLKTNLQQIGVGLVATFMKKL